MSRSHRQPVRAQRPTSRRRRRAWTRPLATGITVLAAAATVVVGYYAIIFAHRIDARLHGEHERVLPRVFARPLDIREGQAMGERQLVGRLNDLGYVRRTFAEEAGEFSVDGLVVTLVPRGGSHRNLTVRATFRRGPGDGTIVTGPVARLEAGGARVRRVTLEAPLLSALIRTARQKRRQVPLAAIPARVTHAVLAIEDRRFYLHVGVDPVRSAGALLTNLTGDLPYLVGGSTLTQQLVKNFFLTPEKTLRRKLLEQFMALVLERRASKDEILELYLNEVYLGQRGSFAVHGVAEGARLFFGKDVGNLTLAEAATLAGIIQSPATLSPFRAPDRARERRNVVLAAMVDAGYVSADAAARAAAEPLAVDSRALDAEAPYFVDFVGRTLARRYPGLTGDDRGLDIHTTLDLHLQRLAEDAVRDGLARIEEGRARRRGRSGPAQAALISVDPRTGDVLAMVGGRSYSESQYNRVTDARRQPGSIFKPFVYLAAFEATAADPRVGLTPATIVVDEPTRFADGDRSWMPANYRGEYDGPITLRQALARSRNVAAVKVARSIGYDRVAALWRRVGVGTPVRPYPSIALGVFEATPYEIAQAYTLFPNQGIVRPLRTITRLVHGRESRTPAAETARPVARPETTFLVTDMLRSVLDEGTAASARRTGLRADMAGKTGTTNELRDAWFAGFTPGLLTVVWVGLDRNESLGLSGSQAALPIWTAFMTRALAGQPDTPFPTPERLTFADIDADTGALAAAGCEHVITEVFLPGTAPARVCQRHRRTGP